MTHYLQPVADSTVNKLQIKLQRELWVRQLLTCDSTGDTDTEECSDSDCSDDSTVPELLDIDD